MAITYEQATTIICTHCDRAIPSLNIDLHNAHCQRNLTKCKICGDMVPKKLVEEHYMTNHAPVACSLCNETMERDILAVHKGESCPQRIVTCEYCEFPLPAVDLGEHQGVCGNRTEYCQLCQKYIRLRERIEHEATVHGSSDSAAGTSRDARRPERREPRPERRRLNGVSHRHLLWTFAITGVAVLLGSIFLQRKNDNSNLLST